ncbi:MAG TPA: ABC transporter permease [Burkholderiales bacterium]|nr:ABC transporter permease [Burkholderiales bacterium]
MSPRRWLAFAAPVLVGLVLLLGWQVLVSVNDVPAYIVPSPAKILATLVHDWRPLADSLLATLQVTLAALAAAVVLGVALSVLFVQSRIIEAGLLPYAVILQVTPLVAIAPLIIIWVDDTRTALVICATVASVFPVITNTTIGLRSVDPGLLDLFRMHGASRLQTLLRLRAPSAAPYFFAGLRVAAALALIGAVVAEFVAGTGGTRSGLAYQILQAGLQLDIPRLFAALALITLAGIALFAAVTLLTRLALRHWHESELPRED